MIGVQKINLALLLSYPEVIAREYSRREDANPDCLVRNMQFAPPFWHCPICGFQNYNTWACHSCSFNPSMSYGEPVPFAPRPRPLLHTAIPSFPHNNKPRFKRGEQYDDYFKQSFPPQGDLLAKPEEFLPPPTAPPIAGLDAAVQSRDFIGQITRLEGDFGVVNDDTVFLFNCVSGTAPANLCVGDRVHVCSFPTSANGTRFDEWEFKARKVSITKEWVGTITEVAPEKFSGVIDENTLFWFRSFPRFHRVLLGQRCKVFAYWVGRKFTWRARTVTPMEVVPLEPDDSGRAWFEGEVVAVMRDFITRDEGTYCDLARVLLQENQFRDVFFDLHLVPNGARVQIRDEVGFCALQHPNSSLCEATQVWWALGGPSYRTGAKLIKRKLISPPRLSNKKFEWDGENDDHSEEDTITPPDCCSTESTVPRSSRKSSFQPDPDDIPTFNSPHPPEQASTARDEEKTTVVAPARDDGDNNGGTSPSLIQQKLSELAAALNYDTDPSELAEMLKMLSTMRKSLKPGSPSPPFQPSEEAKLTMAPVAGPPSFMDAGARPFSTPSFHGLLSSPSTQSLPAGVGKPSLESAPSPALLAAPSPIPTRAPNPSLASPAPAETGGNKTQAFDIPILQAESAVSFLPRSKKSEPFQRGEGPLSASLQQC